MIRRKTTKLGREINRFNSIKLDALKQLRFHIPAENPVQLQQKLQNMGGHQFLMRCAVVAATQPNTVEKSACLFLLNIFIPGWQKHISRESAGILCDDRLRGNGPLYYGWRRAVIERDGKRCQRCGRTDQLHAHHILPWAIFPTERFNVDNGLTLCAPHHKAQH